MRRLWFSLVLLGACAPSADDVAGTRGGRVDVFFNDPGTRPDNLWEPDSLALMIQSVQQAQASIDIAVMGFDRAPLVDAVVAAYDRGVAVRMVGDAAYVNAYGYAQLRGRHIPLVAGNMPHIMHDKYMVIDGRFVWGTTANWTDSDLRQNLNSFVMIDSPEVARAFTSEFEEMFDGAFGASKSPRTGPNVWQVGDTKIEVWFAPKDDCMGRMLEVVDGAQDRVRFGIFAFTKDSLGSALLRKQAELATKNADEGLDNAADVHARHGVAGVIDQSQLHSNGQFHEVYRLLGGDVSLRMDGNDNSVMPGDYQAGGGRLHGKTMIVDPDGEDPMVLTGSFNWSASATQSNDEYLIVMHGKRVAQAYEAWWDRIWSEGREMGVDLVGDPIGGGLLLSPGDVVINELMWYGVTAQDADGADEFVELRNLTDKGLRLDLWQLRTARDFVVGLPPGSYIPPHGLFTILDHDLEPYTDGVPQDDPSAYANGDMVVNAWNDNRQSRLRLSDTALDLRLVDPTGAVMDVAGDGGPPFVGGPDASDSTIARSMERNDAPADGSKADAWHACTSDQGGANVNDTFKATQLATPGESNSAR